MTSAIIYVVMYSEDIFTISQASSGGHESTSDPHTAVREICIKFIIQHAEYHVLREYPGFKIAYDKFVQSLPSGPNSKIVSGPNTNLVYAKALALMLFPPFKDSPAKSLSDLKHVRGRIRNWCYYPIDAVLEILSRYFSSPDTHSHVSDIDLPLGGRQLPCCPGFYRRIWSPPPSWADGLKLSRKPQRYTIKL